MIEGIRHHWKKIAFATGLITSAATAPAVLASPEQPLNSPPAEVTAQGCNEFIAWAEGVNGPATHNYDTNLTLYPGLTPYFPGQTQANVGTVLEACGADSQQILINRSQNLLGADYSTDRSSETAEAIFTGVAALAAAGGIAAGAWLSIKTLSGMSRLVGINIAPMNEPPGKRQYGPDGISTDRQTYSPSHDVLHPNYHKDPPKPSS